MSNNINPEATRTFNTAFNTVPLTSTFQNNTLAKISTAFQKAFVAVTYTLSVLALGVGLAIDYAMSPNKVQVDPTIIKKEDLEYKKTEEPDVQTAEVISGLTHAKKPTMKATRRPKTRPKFNADKHNPIAQQERIEDTQRTEEPRDNTETSRLTNITKAGAIIGGGIALGLGGRKALAYLTYFALDKAGKKALVKGMKKGAEFSAYHSFEMLVNK